MCELYRHFDVDGSLLYVGVSLNSVNRLMQHKRTAHWFESIGRIDVERFATRDLALEAERKAVLVEQPKCNVNLKKQKPRKKQVQASAERIADRLVEFNPMYSLNHAGSLLGVSAATLRKYIADGKLGSVEVMKVKRSHTMVTGWQLINFIEWLQEESTS